MSIPLRLQPVSCSLVHQPTTYFILCLACVYLHLCPSSFLPFSSPSASLCIFYQTLLCKLREAGKMPAPPIYTHTYIAHEHS